MAMAWYAELGFLRLGLQLLEALPDGASKPHLLPDLLVEGPQEVAGLLNRVNGGRRGGVRRVTRKGAGGVGRLQFLLDGEWRY